MSIVGEKRSRSVGDFSLENKRLGKPQAKPNTEELRTVLEGDTLQRTRDAASFHGYISTIIEGLK